MAPTERKSLRRYKGVVARKSGDKTVRVVLNYLYKHPKYGKILSRRTVAHVHDQQNKAHVGDMVEIAKCRPISKNKCWRLLRVMQSTE